MAFGDRLAELLDEKEISQKDFAAQLNIAPTTLNGYIKNKRQPDFELVVRIASVLKVSTDYLLDCQLDNTVHLSIKERGLIENIRKLDNAEREIFYDFTDIFFRDK